MTSSLLRISIIFAILSLTACSSELVRRTYEPVKGGVFRYLNSGASFAISERREDGLRQAKEFCQGPFKVTDESDRPQSSGSYAHQVGNGVLFSDMSSEYTFVSFRCLNDETQQAHQPQ